MTLFDTPDLVVRELAAQDVPALQALFEANPDYFLAVNGQPPGPGEAQQEFDEVPPPHLSYGSRWFAGVHDRAGRLRGLVILLSDLVAQGVWHTALFFLEGNLRGTGAAQALHASLEATARAAGAQWLRLGVIEGNRRAERFWARCGYVGVRTRPLVNAAGETKTARVMVKPLAGGDVATYLRLVPRDAPDSTLP